MKKDVIVDGNIIRDSKYFSERHPFCNCFVFSLLPEKKETENEKSRKLVVEFAPIRIPGDARDEEIQKKFKNLNILYIEKSDGTRLYGHFLSSTRSVDSKDTKPVLINNNYEALVHKRMTSPYDIYIFQSILSQSS